MKSTSIIATNKASSSAFARSQATNSPMHGAPDKLQIDQAIKQFLQFNGGFEETLALMEQGQ